MHMICPFMPMSASTELTYFSIFCRKNYRTPFWRPLCWRRGDMTPSPYPPPLPVSHFIVEFFHAIDYAATDAYDET